MRVIFRVDASFQMGTGHVMRCLTLAQALKENSWNVEFICKKHKGNIIHKIYSCGFIVHEIEDFEKAEIDKKLSHSHWLGSTQQQDASACIKILKHNQTDWLIVDHYALDEDWQKSLKFCYKKLMVIDDLADRRHQCDVLLDQTFDRQQEDYSDLTSKDCQLLLGSQYALLRPEFAEWRPFSIERRRNPEFKQLFINMGGFDQDNVTEKVLDELKICNLPNDLKIIVVMGSLSPHLKSVKSKAITLPFKTEVKIDVDNMAEIMANSDISIGASGSTTWERCCLGLPTIQIVLAENQINIARSLAKNIAIRFIQDVGELSRTIMNVQYWIEDASKFAFQVSDGLGLKRVLSEITDRKL